MLKTYRRPECIVEFEEGYREIRVPEGDIISCPFTKHPMYRAAALSMYNSLWLDNVLEYSSSISYVWDSVFESIEECVQCRDLYERVVRDYTGSFRELSHRRALLIKAHIDTTILGLGVFQELGD